MQISDDLFLGPAFTTQGSDSALGNPSPMEKGVGPMGRVYIFDVVPLVLQTAGLAALQTLLAAGNLTLTAGTGVTTTTDASGTVRYVLDTPRVVTFTSAADESAVTFTVTGYDVFGQRMTQSRAGPNANTVATTKAFKSIISVAASAAVANNTSVGYGDTLGLPIRVTNAVYVLAVKWASTLAQDAGTFTAAVTTDPATATTGDVRGTYLPSSATDGARRLIVAIAVPAIGCGPNATRVGALGVTQA